MKFKQQFCQLQKGKERKGRGREGKERGEERRKEPCHGCFFFELDAFS